MLGHLLWPELVVVKLLLLLLVKVMVVGGRHLRKLVIVRTLIELVRLVLDHQILAGLAVQLAAIVGGGRQGRVVVLSGGRGCPCGVACRVEMVVMMINMVVGMMSQI